MDADEELLALVEDGDTHSRKKQSKKSKKNATMSESGSDMEMDSDAEDAASSSDLEVPVKGSKKSDQSSKKQAAASTSTSASATPASGANDQDDDDETDEENVNPYPLENIYIDEEDRARLLDMPDLKREEIISSRQEEIARKREARDLAKMAADARRGMAASGSNRGSNRSKTVTGTSATRTRKLEELKNERLSKSKARADKPEVDDDDEVKPKRKRSDDDSDGSDYEPTDKLTKKLMQKQKDAADDSRKIPAKLEKLATITIPRDKCIEYWSLPWFAEYVKGGLVRLLIGPGSNGKPDYRLLPVLGVEAIPEKKYTLGQYPCNTYLIVPHVSGEPVKMPMDKVSNSAPTERDYAFFRDMLRKKAFRVISDQDVNEKHLIVEKYRDHVMTEADVKAMLDKRGRKKNVVQRELERREKESKVEENPQPDVFTTPESTDVSRANSIPPPPDRTPSKPKVTKTSSSLADPDKTVIMDSSKNFDELMDSQVSLDIDI